MAHSNSVAFGLRQDFAAAAPNRRARLLASLSSGAFVALALGAAPAAAQTGACGPAVDGQVTCTPAGNPYPNGITYSTPGSLTVTLADGVVVDAPGRTAVLVNSTGAGSTRIDAAAGATIANSRLGLFTNALSSTGGNAEINNAAPVQATAAGVIAQANTSTSIVNSGAVNIAAGTGTGATQAIFSFARTGNVAVTNSGPVTVQSNGFASGIQTSSGGANAQTVIGNSGAITITQGSGSTAPSLGIRAFSGGADSSVVINNTGAISITGGSNALGITTFVNGNSTTTTSAPVTVTAARATGIFAQTSSATGNVVVNSTGVIQANSTADAAPAPAINEAGGIYTTALNGSTTINAGTVQTAGNSTPGISAGSDAGAISITSANVSTTGNDSFGIEASTTSGPVTVRSGAVSTTGAGSRAISIANDTGTIDIGSTGAVSTTGDLSSGIVAQTGGAIRISNTGSVSTTGRDSGAVFALSDGGGNVTITGRGTVTTTGVNSFGVVGASVGGGNVSIQTGAVSTTGAQATGIGAASDTGNVTVDAASVTTAGADSNAVTAASGPGVVQVNTGTIATTGANAIGIRANTTTGRITIASGRLSTTGQGSTGILATSDSGRVSVTNSGALTTTGQDADGIVATTAGAIDIVNTGSVTTSGLNSDGIVATGGGDVTFTGRGSVTTRGGNALGINATSNNGNVSVQAGAVGTTGAGSTGVLANSLAGFTNVDVTSASTTGAGAIAIDARSTLGTNVTAGTVTTTGAGATGISATSTSGGVTVNAQNVTVSGLGATAILARGDDAVSVTSGNASSVNFNAISATSTSGPVNVLITGAARSAQGTAVNIDAATLGRLDVRAGGSVQGGVSAVTITAPGGSFVNNAGTITGGTGFAIFADGGPAGINNSGTITGRVRLTGGADNFVNSGTFNANQPSDFGAGNDTLNNTGTLNANAVIDFGAGDDRLSNNGTINANAAINFGAGNDTLTNTGRINANAGMDFGAGTDTFNNSGILAVLSGNRPVGTVNLAGLESFNNSGLVDLRNGRTGDVLSLPGTFTGTGNSALGLDVAFGAPGASDRLVVGNAQGSTALLLATTGDPLLGVGPVLVQGSSASAPGAFTRATQQAGLVQVDLVYNPTTFSFALVGTPSNAAFRTTVFAGAIRSLWHESADAWSAQMREGRDTAFSGNQGEAGGRFWIQGHGRLSEREADGDLVAFGQTRNVDLSFNQDFFGAQVGFDFGGPVGDQGGFAFGVTGGYVDSQVQFQGTGDDLEMQAVNVGAYGRFSAGPFFINGLAKYDHILDISGRSIRGDFEADLDGNVYGGQLEAGLRFGSRGFYVEPVATISYVKSDLDGFAVRGTSVDFDADDGIRGSAGARIGSAFSISRGAVANVYAGAHYVHEFSGNDEVLLTSGANTVRLSSLEDEDFVRGVVGINIASAGNVSGFIEGNGEFLNDREGFGARGGIRIRF